MLAELTTLQSLPKALYAGSCTPRADVWGMFQVRLSAPLVCSPITPEYRVRLMHYMPCTTVLYGTTHVPAKIELWL